MKFSFPFAQCFYSSPNSTSEAPKSQHDETIGESIRLFSYEELKSATQGFRPSCKIGEGGFGSVYKGRLQGGSFVAVKVLSVELESLRGEREFVSEIAALSVIKHENLVTLRGCCVDGANRLLVYDYMENNSLIHAFLGAEQSRMRFSWRLRKEICLGVAKALSYLHEEVNPHMVHRDIKASNIVLDHNFTPKVADFGLARLFRGGISHISTRVAGTLGYLSPEYAVSGHFTRKSDVYSFGVLLLEIVSGSPIIAFDLERGEHFLVNKDIVVKMSGFHFDDIIQAWDMYKADQLLQLVDPLLEGQFPAEEADRFLKTGLLCVQETTALRPKMSTAIKMLNNEAAIDENIKISRPGIVANLRDVKIRSSNNTSIVFPL